MSLHIEWKLPPSSWRRFLETCPNATFFHSPGWYQAHAERADYVPQAVHFRWSDGQEALLPLAFRPIFRGLATEGLAGIESGYGGLVSPIVLSPQRVTEAYSAVRRRYSNLRVQGNPHERYPNTPEFAGSSVSEDVTHLLPVMEPEAQRQRMSKMRQRHAKAADKVGFHLEVIEAPTVEVVPWILGLYQAHSATWAYRRWVRDESYFRSLFRQAGRDLVLFMAYQKSQLAGFHLVGCFGGTAMELHLATDEAFEKLQVGTYLIEKPLAWLYDRGYRVFDFIPSGQLAGVAAYKASFGAEAVPQRDVALAGLWGRFLGSVRALGNPMSPKAQTT